MARPNRSWSSNKLDFSCHQIRSGECSPHRKGSFAFGDEKFRSIPSQIWRGNGDKLVGEAPVNRRPASLLQAKPGAARHGPRAASPAGLQRRGIASEMWPKFSPKIPPTFVVFVARRLVVVRRVLLRRSGHFSAEKRPNTRQHARSCVVQLLLGTAVSQ